MFESESFWGSQGRIARITRGEFQGCFAFVYPDTEPHWWTIVVDPSPYPDAPYEMYFDGTDELLYFVREWGLDWLPRQDDEEIEKHHFGWRPLSGHSWIKGR